MRMCLRSSTSGIIFMISPSQNYNKSRIHSARGARHVEMFLDCSKIFSGEIVRASAASADDTAANSEVQSRDLA